MGLINNLLQGKNRGIFALVIVILTAIVIVLVIIVLLKFKSSTPQQSGGTPSLNIWGVNIPPSAMNIVIADFKKIDPAVNITYTQEPTDNYKDLVVGRLSSNSANKPDIVVVGNTWIPLIQKYLNPAPSSVYTLTDYKNTFYPTAVSDLTTKNGSIYAAPLEYDGLGLYYNTQLLKNAGYTTPASNFFDFINQAERLTITQNQSSQVSQAGLAAGTADNIFNASDILSLFMLQNGVQLTDGTFNTTATFNTASGENALRFYTELSSKYNLWDSTFPDAVTAFANGKVAMIYAPIWAVQNIKQINPNLDFNIAPAPQLDNTVNLSNYLAYSVTNASTNQNEAWKFIKFYETPNELQAVFNQTKSIYGIGSPYPRQDMASLLQNSQFYDAYVKMAPTATSWHQGDDSVASKAFNTAIDDVISGKTITAALNTAAGSVSQELVTLYKQNH